jgi:uncharacterized protein (DUF849 family)
MKNNKVILTAAITGSVHIPSMSPYLPITPEAIVAQSVEAARAGAAVVHLHGRDPKTGEPSTDLKLMRQVVSAIKEQCDVIICISTGASQMMSVQERLSAVPELKPELASCNAGSMNFVLSGLLPQVSPDAPAWEKKYLGGTYDNVFANTYQGLETYIRTMQANGTVPEFEVYDAGMINNIANFKKQGILTCPIYMQFVLGIQGGLPASVDNLVFLRQTAEKQLDAFTWSCAAAGRHQFPLTTAAMAMGGSARVGLEDNLYLRPHVLAKSNAEQIRSLVTVAGVLGREVATAEEARQILGLKGLSQVNY